MNFSAIFCAASAITVIITASGCANQSAIDTNADRQPMPLETTSEPASSEVVPGPTFRTVSRPMLPPTLVSGLQVPGGETFHLGERRTGDFTVSARNRGGVAVRLILSRDGKTADIATLGPGETAVGRFESGDGILVRNLSNTITASLRVEVWGTNNLAMYYTESGDDAPADSGDLD